MSSLRSPRATASRSPRAESRGLTALVLLALAACTPTEPYPFGKTSVVRGDVVPPAGMLGDAWLFLYQPHQGPPGTPAVPPYATAVSAARLASGDAHFVFPEVAANPYRLWGLLDVDGNFDPNIDVLAQPGAGDQTGQGVEVNVQPGKTLVADYPVAGAVTHEPPAFHLDGVAAGDLALDAPTNGLTVLTLVSDDMEHRLDVKRTAFVVGLVDANGDGRPDVDASGVPQLSLQLFLRWKPKPGQWPAGTTVIVPVTYGAAPFLLSLNGRLGVTVEVAQLQGTIVPQAQEVLVDSKGASTFRAVGAPPTGDYELIALSGTGQFWRLPNQLGPQIGSQALKLHFDRASP